MSRSVEPAQVRSVMKPISIGAVLLLLLVTLIRCDTSSDGVSEPAIGELTGQWTLYPNGVELFDCSGIASASHFEICDELVLDMSNREQLHAHRCGSIAVSLHLDDATASISDGRLSWLASGLPNLDIRRFEAVFSTQTETLVVAPYEAYEAHLTAGNLLFSGSCSMRGEWRGRKSD